MIDLRLRQWLGRAMMTTGVVGIIVAMIIDAKIVGWPSIVVTLIGQYMASDLRLDWATFGFWMIYLAMLIAIVAVVVSRLT